MICNGLEGGGSADWKKDVADDATTEQLAKSTEILKPVPSQALRTAAESLDKDGRYAMQG